LVRLRLFIPTGKQKIINKATIAQFLARKLPSYDWLKQCTAAALDKELRALRPSPQFGLPSLWLHQKACFLILLELKRFLLFIDMGGGKTRLILELLKYRKQRGEQPRAIVFVPYTTSVDTWIEQTAEHTPTLKCVPLLGTGAENLALLNTTGDLFVVCYQTAVSMLSTRASNKKRGKKKWVLSAAKVRETFAGFDTLIGDELHKCKSVSSLTYKMCRAISTNCEYVVGLTGTPFGSDPGDLWAQFYLIDFGETLGPTLGFYRSVFFREKINYWGGYEHSFKKRMLPKLTKIIKNNSISYTIDEFYDLPPKEYVVKKLPPPPNSSTYCERAISDMRDALKGKHWQAVNSSYLQLRQLSSGFMTLQGEDNAKLQLQFAESPKLDALVELLEGVPYGRKTVIFHHFVYTNEIISAKLKELKIKHARIWSGQRDPIAELRRFKADPDCAVLVLNWKSGSSSLNLQNASYLIVYEQPESPIDRKQGEARLWRPGQKNRVVIYDLLVKQTVDVKMHKANEAGKNLLDELLNKRETL
jgi:SNF2 family DNA or RNA helicase